MEKLDRELQKRVWDRVQSREVLPSPIGENLKGLILLAQENAVAYGHIAGSVHGKRRECILKMYREARQSVACMRGICRLQGEAVQPLRLPVPAEPVSRCLEKCYRRERQLWSEYRRRSNDPEHGAVFSGLARQSQGRCMAITEILGGLKA